MWKHTAHVILRNRILILGILLALTVFFGFHAPSVKMEYTYASLLPEGDSTRIKYLEFKEKFGEDANMLVIGFEDPNLFEIDKFRDFNALTSKLKSFDGVINAASITNVLDLKADHQKERFYLSPLFPDSLKNQEQLDSLANRLTDLPFYDQMLYNDSSKMYVIGLTLKTEVMNSPAREDLIDSIEHNTRQFGSKHDITPHFSGMPYIRTRLAEKIRSEFVYLVLLAIAVASIILYVFFRSFKVIAFTLLIVITAASWSIGMMVLFGYNISILTSLLPPLIIVIGIPNCVYLLNKYHQEFKIHGNKVKSLQRMILRVGNATFLTNLTTAAGFGTFLITRNRLLIEFGLVAFLSIMGVFLLSILLIPIFFSYLPDPKLKHINHLDSRFMNRITDRLSIIATQHRPKVFITIGGLVALAIVGLSMTQRLAYIVDDLPQDDPLYADLKFFEKHMGGVMPMEISIDTRRPKGVLKKKNLLKLDSLQQRLNQYDELARPMSVIDALKFMRQAYYNGKAKYYEMSADQDLNFILSYIKKESGQMDAVASFLDSTNQSTRITMKIEDVGTKRMGSITKEIEEDITAVFPADQYKTNLTGASIVYTQGTEHLIRNLFTSLALAVVLISIFMASMFTSLRMVLISLIPNLLPLLFTAALMGYFGVPIKPSNVLVFSIAFGIAVDNSIHYLAKYRQELKLTDFDVKQAVHKAIKETGVSMIYTAIILFFGFLVFTASGFGGTKAVGILVSITLAIAVLTNLTLLPALILALGRKAGIRKQKRPLLDNWDKEDIENGED